MNIFPTEAADFNVTCQKYLTKGYALNPNPPQKIVRDNQNWEVFSYSKEVKGWKYVALVIKTLAYTFLLVPLLFSESLRDDWRTILNGTKTRLIYKADTKILPPTNTTAVQERILGETQEHPQVNIPPKNPPSQTGDENTQTIVPSHSESLNSIASTTEGTIPTSPQPSIETKTESRTITPPEVLIETKTESTPITAPEVLIAKAGKWAQYYTDEKNPIKTFLETIGCVLDGRHFTTPGDNFLTENEYAIVVDATKDFYNPDPVTIIVSAAKIREIIASSTLVVSPELGVEKYRELLKAVQNTMNEDLQKPTSESDPYPFLLHACMVSHSIRLPSLTQPYLNGNLAHQQLISTNLDHSNELILISSSGINLSVPICYKYFFDTSGGFADGAFRNLATEMWKTIIFSCMQQKATDLSLLAIGLGAFISRVRPEYRPAIRTIYLETLKSVIDNDTVRDHFKHGIFFARGPIPDDEMKAVFKDCKTKVHIHEADAANLAQHISAEEGRCCALLNPSDPDVIFGRCNIGEHWQFSKKNKGDMHVGEEFLMHFLLGMLGSYQMCPEAFENPILIH